MWQLWALSEHGRYDASDFAPLLTAATVSLCNQRDIFICSQLLVGPVLFGFRVPSCPSLSIPDAGVGQQMMNIADQESAALVAQALAQV